MTAALSRDALTLDLAQYAARRTAARDRMIPLRRGRRLRLGDQLVLEFENAETLTYQVQEMLFTEGITDEADVAAELAAYSRLLPSSHELTATLFLEFDDVSAVRDELRRLAGVQHAIRIEVGGERVPAVELPGPDEDGPSEETYSVHFLKFRFSDQARDAFRDPSVPALLVVDHPEYADDTPIDGDARKSLLADLALTTARSEEHSR
ncbi:MAG TPA: DUF3501 family protein [Mycobacteriales bacterium]|nr:DUF3501 family protein [Mycobacteriales bacterium]